ncbi:hypothetical protein OMCYN_01109 [cyanobiont of Ornithocercus magnificus]|nr:hypothetical protein OMCYN_01109 [cyanobiont of Ornithocercus magnificus]
MHRHSDKIGSIISNAKANRYYLIDNVCRVYLASVRCMEAPIPNLVASETLISR